MKEVSLPKMVVWFVLAAFLMCAYVETAFAQEPVKPVVNLTSTGEKIAQFGIVVKDVDKVAKRFSEIFGTSWRFYDFKPKGIVLRGKELGDAECLMKVAIGDMGGRSFKLIQPVSGPSTYMEFLQNQGEGLLYFSLGFFEQNDRFDDLSRYCLFLFLSGCFLKFLCHGWYQSKLSQIIT